MTNFYAIAQYAPDPVKDERVNFGVFAFGGGEVRYHFLTNWSRVRQFGGEAIDFIHDFVRSVRGIDEAGIRRIAATWENSVQIAEPRASLLPLHDLIIYAAKRFLLDPTPAVLGYRRKDDIVRILRSQLRESLINQIGGHAAPMLRRYGEVRGEHMNHTFDFCVANGEAYFAAQALSFEIPETKKLQKDVDATAWSIEDVRSAQGKQNFKIGVVSLPPRNPTDLYDSAVKTFRALGADVLGEGELRNWANNAVALVQG